MNGRRAIIKARVLPALALVLAIVAVAAAACADLEEPFPQAVASPSPATPALTPQPSDLPTPLPAGDSPKTVTASPVMVAFGPQTAVLYEREGDIWAVDPASGDKGVVATGLQHASLFGPSDPWALAPGGQMLAMACNLQEQPALLVLVELPGGQPVEVGRYEGRIDALSWSHDGDRLAFLVSRRDDLSGQLVRQSLWLYDLAAGREVTLYSREFRPEETSRLGLWLESWVPGDRALYVVYALEGTDDPGTLYALDARGGEPQLVSEEYLLKGGRPVCTLTSEVLLRRRASGLGAGWRASPLYVARAELDGSLTGVRLLSPEDWIVGAVAWSPEGQRVVAERHEIQTHGTYSAHLWLLALDGSAPRQLTSDPTYREERPVWMPDALQIVFDRWQAARPEPAGLWTLGPDSELRLLDDRGARPQTSHWLSGSRRLPASTGD